MGRSFARSRPVRITPRRPRKPCVEQCDVDLGPARSWGERFPSRATAFAEELPPAREVLAESRTLKGGRGAMIGAQRFTPRPISSSDSPRILVALLRG
jgi:hypothetical protein